MDESVEVKYYISVQIADAVDSKESAALLGFVHVSENVRRYRAFETGRLLFIFIILYLFQILSNLLALGFEFLVYEFSQLSVECYHFSAFAAEKAVKIVEEVVGVELGLQLNTPLGECPQNRGVFDFELHIRDLAIWIFWNILWNLLAYDQGRVFFYLVLSFSQIFKIFVLLLFDFLFFLLFSAMISGIKSKITF